MKNYYIDRYITLYNKNEIIETQKADRVQVPDEITGRAMLLSKQPQAIENKNGFSMYECYIMVIKNDDRQYKRLVNEITPQGIIINV